MTFCGFLLGLGYLLTSQIDSVWQLYLFYGVIIGIGMSGSWVPLLSTVARWFVARRSLMTGIVLGGNGIGGLIGPLVANWLISTYDWRTSYIILGSTVLVIVVLAGQLLRRDPTQMGQVPYGRKEGEEQRLELGTPGFSLKEAAHTRQFWLFFGVVFCYGYSLFTILVHLVPHATDLGVSGASAANILATYAGLTIVGSVVLGSAGDRIGNKQVYIISLILVSAALFWLVPATRVWTLYLFAIVFGFAMGGLAATESPLLAGFFGLRSHGLIFGVVGGGFTIGAAAGPFLTGYIFDVRGSYKLAFLVSAAISVVGLVLTALLRPVVGERSKI
jgi:MFS family permease